VVGRFWVCAKADLKEVQVHGSEHRHGDKVFAREEADGEHKREEQLPVRPFPALSIGYRIAPGLVRRYRAATYNYHHQ
jgi:hypothetical protein